MSGTHAEIPQEEQDRIAEQIALLGNKDGMVRRQARHRLVETGRPVVPALIDVLAHEKNLHRRWEAAKALGTLRSPEAAGPLVEALMDNSTEIRWLAAEALIALELDALRPLMAALFEHPDDVDLRHGAHHVLHALEKSKRLDEASQQVLDVLRSIEPEVGVPVAAHRAMEALGNV